MWSAAGQQPAALTAKPCSVAWTASLVELLPVLPITATSLPNLQHMFGITWKNLP